MTDEEEEKIYTEIEGLKATADEAKRRADDARTKGNIEDQKQAQLDQLTALARIVELLKQL